MRILGNGVDIIENRRIKKAIKNKKLLIKYLQIKKKNLLNKKTQIKQIILQKDL